MSVCAVVGGQFGSEGKGLIVSKIAGQYDHHVRVGAANAGHTLYDPTGEKHVMQQIPCAAYANPLARLYIGPGAIISLDILKKEIDLLNYWRRRKGIEQTDVFVDHRAHIIQPHHVELEQASGLAERIGSTSTIAREGIGAAQADRVMRGEHCVTAGECSWDPSDHVALTDVPAELAGVNGILLEGTQGTGLSLTTGDFPYVTSRNTTSAGLAAECGVAPSRLDRIILVCRTYPIRVAGNSGPFYDGSREIKWEDIGIDPESERTTVTKKIRRVATWSMKQVLEAIYLNGATEIAVTFADYIDPEIAGKSGSHYRWDGPTWKLLDTIKKETTVPIRMLGTGPQSVINLK